MLKTSFAVALCCVLALAGVGCGGGSDAESTVNEFVSAWTDGEYDTACELTNGAAVTGSGSGSSSPDDSRVAACAATLEKLQDKYEDELEHASSDEGKETVDETDTTAKVTSDQGDWELEKTDDEWLITRVPFIGS